MKRRTLIIIISVIAAILLAEFIVYEYLLRFFPLINSRTIPVMLKILYWTVLPLLIGSSLYILKKYYRSQNPAFSGTMFRIAGLFVLVYIPKIFLALILVLKQIIFWCYKLLLIVISSGNHDKVLLINEKPFDLISFIALCMSILMFGIILYGITSGRFGFKVKRISLTFELLPDNFDGLKVIQISDLHTGSLYRNKKRFNKVASIINKEKPGLIFFTGDIVNEFAGELDGWESFFSRLNAEYGKFSILGNHDYGDYYPWKSTEEKEVNTRKIIDFETRMGFRVLMNESASINIDGKKISILGVENWGLRMFKRYGKLNSALEGTDNNTFKILLSHDPSHWDAEIVGKTDIGLTLSGHTHGFQFGIRTRWIKWSPVRRIYPRWEGLHQVGNQYMYVNTGLGYIGFPGRIGIPPEITVITLFTSNSDMAKRIRR
jgi:predicted MPP superfamily phosphohydrolase